MRIYIKTNHLVFLLACLASGVVFVASAIWILGKIL